MNDFETASFIRSIILQTWAEQRYYRWNERMRGAHRLAAIEQIDKLKVNFSNLSLDELKQLNFGNWDEAGLRLIPLWLYDNIAVGQVLTSISNKTRLITEDYRDAESASYIDKDTRFGCLAWGVIKS